MNRFGLVSFCLVTAIGFSAHPRCFDHTDAETVGLASVIVKGRIELIEEASNAAEGGIDVRIRVRVLRELKGTAPAEINASYLFQEMKEPLIRFRKGGTYLIGFSKIIGNVGSPIVTSCFKMPPEERIIEIVKAGKK